MTEPPSVINREVVDEWIKRLTPKGSSYLPALMVPERFNYRLKFLTSQRQFLTFLIENRSYKFNPDVLNMSIPEEFRLRKSRNDPNLICLKKFCSDFYEKGKTVNIDDYLPYKNTTTSKKKGGKASTKCYDAVVESDQVL